MIRTIYRRYRFKSIRRLVCFECRFCRLCEKYDNGDDGHCSTSAHRKRVESFLWHNRRRALPGPTPPPAPPGPPPPASGAATAGAAATGCFGATGCGGAAATGSRAAATGFGGDRQSPPPQDAVPATIRQGLIRLRELEEVVADMKDDVDQLKNDVRDTKGVLAEIKDIMTRAYSPPRDDKASAAS